MKNECKILYYNANLFWACLLFKKCNYNATLRKFLSSPFFLQIEEAPPELNTLLENPDVCYNTGNIQLSISGLWRQLSKNGEPSTFKFIIKKASDYLVRQITPTKKVRWSAIIWLLRPCYLEEKWSSHTACDGLMKNITSGVLLL